MSGALFTVLTAAGSAALAFWLDVRFPGLAPSGVGRRLLAVVVAVVLLQGATVAFEAVLASPRAASQPPELAALAALGVLLPALVGGFLTALWLIRSLPVFADGR